MATPERTTYRGEKSVSEECKKDYISSNFNQPCFQAEAKQIGMRVVDKAIIEFSTTASICRTLRPLPDDLRRKRVLTVFDPATLAEEKAAWANSQPSGGAAGGPAGGSPAGSPTHEMIAPLVKDLLAKADRGLTLRPYSVILKLRKVSEDKRC